MCGPPLEARGLGADGEILAIYLRRSTQGQGIGRQLMARAAEFWLGQAGRSLVVLSLRDNHGAARFYEALGGVVVYSGCTEIGEVELANQAHRFSDLAALRN
jgi:GNAT superfamily N-acetyltransferase